MTTQQIRPRRRLRYLRNTYDPIVDAMYEAYLNGIDGEPMTLRKLARVYGRPASNLAIMFQRRGWPLRHRNEYPKMEVDGIRFSKSKRGKWISTARHAPSVMLHRYVYEKHRGPIPKGYEVYHLDGDVDHNSIDNLGIRKYPGRRNRPGAAPPS